jgi:hypothetical protein
MATTLSKANLIRLSCYLRQGERTFDRALNASWQQVRDYYVGVRGQELRSFLNRFPAELALASESEIAALRSRAAPRRSLKKLFAQVRMRLSILWQPHYALDDSEVRLFLFTLRRILQLVSGRERPDQADLVRLRMDANLSVSLIQSRYGACLDFDRIMKVDHFLPPEFTRCYTVDEILASR